MSWPWPWLGCGLPNKLSLGVDDMISGKNDTKCVSKCARATAPRVETGSPSVPQKLSLVAMRCFTKAPQRVFDVETTGIASEWRVLSPEKTASCCRQTPRH